MRWLLTCVAVMIGMTVLATGLTAAPLVTLGALLAVGAVAVGRR